MNYKNDMDSVVINILRNYILRTNNLNNIYFEMFIVWKAKVLQNYKYLLATNIPDDKYYEITYNGDRKEFYIDEYVKINNTVMGWDE